MEESIDKLLNVVHKLLNVVHKRYFQSDGDDITNWVVCVSIRLNGDNIIAIK